MIYIESSETRGFKFGPTILGDIVKNWLNSWKAKSYRYANHEPSFRED